MGNTTNSEGNNWNKLFNNHSPVGHVNPFDGKLLDSIFFATLK